jgi:Rrf2 family protein
MRVNYAARAIIDLAEHYGDGPTRTGDIAARHGIPEPFLEQVLRRLRNAGLVQSVRGPTGGYLLAQLPAAMTLGDVVQALGEEPLHLHCLQDGHCTVLEHCVLAEVWQELAFAYQQMLNAVTAQQLVERVAARASTAMYHI